MKRLSIRARLSLFFTTAVAGIVVIFGVVLILITRQQLLHRTDAALREELREILLEVELHKSVDDFQAAAQSRFYHHDIYDFIVVDHRNAILFVSAGLTPRHALELAEIPETKIITFATQDLSEGDSVRFASSSAIRNFGRLRLFAVTSLQPLITEQRMLRTVAVCLLPILLIIALAIGYGLAGRVLAPVTLICETANSITIDSLNRRIDVPNPHDELGALAETLNSLIARLDQAVNEIRRFTADASHELRTPLAALKLEAELALRAERTPRQYQTALSVVVEEANRLCRLADQLLSLSREDAGIVPRVEERVPVHAILEDVIHQLQPMAFQRSILLSAENIDSSEVVGSDLQLRQVFLNLIENALKFTKAGGSVHIGCKSLDATVICKVQDTGPGISAEHLPHVFKRFYRADMSRNCESGGTGLGLSIAERIVKAHGGTIVIESEVKLGTTVTVTLPGRSIHQSIEVDGLTTAVSSDQFMESIA